MKVLSRSKSTGGTSFHDNTITASVNELIAVMGEPSYSGNDGEDKVNFEWEMETEEGEVFTVYDWKEYRPLSRDEQIEWHIGAHSRRIGYSALVELSTALENIFK